jgi:hypothetical protein
METSTMADIFVSVPGSVVAFELTQATVGQINVPAEIVDPKLKDLKQPSPVIFGSMAWKQQTHQQFSNSLDGSVYIYVFGDQMGTIEISGFAFARLCGTNEDGLQKVLEYYKQNRASQRATPIQVNVASQTVQGFLTSIEARTLSGGSPEAIVHQYNLGINALP